MPVRVSSIEEKRKVDNFDVLNEFIVGMTTDFGKTNLPWKGRRSAFLGASCFLYILPSITVAYFHPQHKTSWARQRWHWAWVLQCVFSFFSDYVTSGVDSICHGIDRWYAPTMTLFVTSLAYLCIHPTLLVLLAPPWMCIMMSKRARLSKNWDGYVFYHSLWHLVGSVLAAYVTYLACSLPVADDSTDKRIDYFF